jgi:hypothetical protein
MDQMKSAFTVIGAVGLVAYLASLVVDVVFLAQVDSGLLSADINPSDYWMALLCAWSLVLAGLGVAVAYYDVVAQHVRWRKAVLVAASVQIGTVLIWLVVSLGRDLPMLSSYLRTNAAVIIVGTIASAILIVIVTRRLPMPPSFPTDRGKGKAPERPMR